MSGMCKVGCGGACSFITCWKVELDGWVLLFLKPDIPFTIQTTATTIAITIIIAKIRMTWAPERTQIVCIVNYSLN